MNNKGMDYDNALKLAQEKGFAESNPVFDVGGFDSLYKLIILCVHSFGLYVHPDKVLNVGISNITPFDMQYANEKGTKIKLVARVERVSNDDVSLLVLPEFVSKDNYIYNVEDEYNGVVIEGRYYEKQFMFGKGAGAFPTGSSVLSDITARTHDYKYEYKKKYINTELSQAEEHEIRIYLRYKNLVDFSLFDFEEIEEKYSSRNLNYVVGRIKVSKLMNIRKLLHKLDLFIVKLQEGNE
jgi:homoserine dehydrogenase